MILFALLLKNAFIEIPHTRSVNCSKTALATGSQVTAVGFWLVTFVSMRHLQEFLSSWKHQRKAVRRKLEEVISQGSVRLAASLGINHARPSTASQETSRR